MSSPFFTDFVCGCLANQVETRDLVKLTEDDKHFFVRFNDIDKISVIYCDFKEEKVDKLLCKEEKKRKDNVKKTLEYFEKRKPPLLKGIESGKTDKKKSFIKYEVIDDKLWNTLRNYFPLRRMRHENFRASHGETSSDTGLDTTKSDDQSPDETHQNVRESCSMLSSDQSSSREVSQSDDPYVNENHENSSVSHSVLSSEPYSGVPQPDDQLVEDVMFLESRMPLVELNVHLDKTGVVSQSVDPLLDQANTSSESETFRPPPLSTAVDEVQLATITPDCCSTEGGSSFIIEAEKGFQSGTYNVEFSYRGLSYGTCDASGDGTKYLKGLGKIPAAKRRGTHFADVEVRNETGERVGVCSLKYQDNMTNLSMEAMVADVPKSSEHPHNERRKPTKKSSSDSTDTVSNKKFKSCPIDMPMLMYFCDEMAKRGDEDFFSALIKLGILAKVLVNRSEYYEDFAEIAREYGHNKLAETIVRSSRELPCDRDMETLTIGKLLDVVQQERSLANSDPVSSDDDSCSSGYNGDCDSEDGQCCTNGSLKENKGKTDAVLGSCNSHYDGDLNGEKNSVNVALIQEPEPVAIDVEKKEHIFEDEDNGEKTSLVERSLNPNQEEIVAGVDNKTTDFGCYSHLTKLGKTDLQWKERCEESMITLEELTGIPDTGKPSFTKAGIDKIAIALARASSLWQECEDFRKDESRILVTVRPGTGKSVKSVIALARARSLWQDCEDFRKKRKLVVCHLDFSDSNLKNPNVMLQSLAIQMCENASVFKAKLLDQVSSEYVNPWLDVQLLIVHDNLLRAKRPLAKERLRDLSRAMHDYEKATDVEPLCSAAVETPMSCSRHSADDQFSMTGSLKENEDKTDGVLGSCNSHYDGEAVKPGSHFKEFTLGTAVDFGESKTVQFKQLLAKRTNNTSLAQRLIKDGNVSSYVSAFANHSGGHVYVGVHDDGIVQEEKISPQDQTELKKKINIAIGNMIWPDNSHTQDGEEKRWQIVGGLERDKDERGKETNKASYEADVDEMLTELLNDNCEWSELKKAAANAQITHDEVDVRLICLSKLIKFCLRKGYYKNADEMFEEYKTILPQSAKVEVFEIMEQYLHCFKERSKGNYEKSYEIADQCLKKLDEIQPGIVSAAFFALIATVVNIIAMEKKNRSEWNPLVTKAKEFYATAERHLQYVHGFEIAKADLKQKIYMNKAMLFLGSSLAGNKLADPDASVISKAEAQNCLDKSEHIVTNEMFPPSEFRDIQHNFAQSDFFYRYSNSDKPLRDRMKKALKFAKRAERSANDAGLLEMRLYARNRVGLIQKEICKCPRNI